MPAKGLTHTLASRAKMAASHIGIPALWNRRDIRIEKGIELYQCGACKKYFPREGFYRNKRNLLGLTTECRKCHGLCSMRTRNRENTLRLKRDSEARLRTRKASGIETITPMQMRTLEEPWGHKCVQCGTTAVLTWDHITSLSKGGSHSLENLQRMCRPHNETKHARFADYRSQEQKFWVYQTKTISTNKEIAK